MAEQPKILPHREAIERVIAGDLLISQNDINVKATTMEKLGFVGREEGIAAQVAVLLKQK